MGPKVNNVYVGGAHVCFDCVCMCIYVCGVVSKASCLVGVTVSRYRSTSPWHKLSLAFNLTDKDTHMHKVLPQHTALLFCLVGSVPHYKVTGMNIYKQSYCAICSMCWLMNGKMLMLCYCDINGLFRWKTLGDLKKAWIHTYNAFWNLFPEWLHLHLLFRKPILGRHELSKKLWGRPPHI